MNENPVVLHRDAVGIERDYCERCDVQILSTMVRYSFDIGGGEAVLCPTCKRSMIASGDAVLAQATR